MTIELGTETKDEMPLDNIESQKLDEQTTADEPTDRRKFNVERTEANTDNMATEQTITTSTEKLISVDRTKIPPFLVKVFCRQNAHNLLQSYDSGVVLGQENLIYTWKDVSIRELADLVKDACPPAKKDRIKLSFTLVYFHYREARHRSRDLGTVVPKWNSEGVLYYPPRSHEASDPEKFQPFSVRFNVGDFIDVAVIDIGPRSRPPGRSNNVPNVILDDNDSWVKDATEADVRAKEPLMGNDRTEQDSTTMATDNAS